MDIDECALSNPCGANSACSNTAGGYTCMCQPGFVSSNGACVDVDECGTGEANCPEPDKSECVNLLGSFECRCKAGFNGNPGSILGCIGKAPPPLSPSAARAGRDCRHQRVPHPRVLLRPQCRLREYRGRLPLPVHQGLPARPGRQWMHRFTPNIPMVGYRIHSHLFPTDIDECVQAPCDSAAVCVNSAGGFECRCLNGYAGDGFTCSGSHWHFPASAIFTLCLVPETILYPYDLSSPRRLPSTVDSVVEVNLNHPMRVFGTDYSRLYVRHPFTRPPRNLPWGAPFRSRPMGL